MRLELGPAGEPELAGDHQLGVGAREAVELRRAGLGVRQARVELAHDLGCAGVAGADRALEGLGALLELLEVGVAGKTAGWHTGLLSPGPGVRNRRPERRTDHKHNHHLQVGFALSADRQRPARTPIITRARTPSQGVTAPRGAARRRGGRPADSSRLTRLGAPGRSRRCKRSASHPEGGRLTPSAPRRWHRIAAPPSEGEARWARRR